MRYTNFINSLIAIKVDLTLFKLVNQQHIAYNYVLWRAQTQHLQPVGPTLYLLHHTKRQLTICYYSILRMFCLCMSEKSIFLSCIVIILIVHK